jgi:diazepam-binding inhibitor (GABA receptor modulating acyl-CoA-binding protein)
LRIIIIRTYSLRVDSKFNKAAEDIKNLTEKPTNEELLMLYGLYKQATVGDVSGDRPGMFDPKGRAKWDAWQKNEGMEKNDAKEEYVKYANTLLQKYPSK